MTEPPAKKLRNTPKNAPASAPSETIPNFVKQYYETSTFHHLSQWRLKFQQVTSEIQQGKRRRFSEDPVSAKTGSDDDDEAVPADLGLTSMSGDYGSMSDVTGLPEKKIIFHVDLDCFYVSVAVRDDPTLAGRPVAVTPASQFNGTSEIASCSYEARAFGVKSRMHIRDARKLCPDLVCVPCRYNEYEKVSEQIYKIFLNFTNRLQAVSADEAYLDMSTFPDPIATANELRKEIKETTGCPASVGIAHNLLLARIATKKAKPNGIYMVKEDEVATFMAGVSVKDLPSVGPATALKLHQKKIATVADLLKVTKEQLQHDFGPKNGEMLWNYARGIDQRTISASQERKSVGTQISWGVRFHDIEQVKQFLDDVAAEVAKRMNALGVKGRRINFRIKKKAPGASEPTKLFNPGKHIVVNKTATLAQFTNDPSVISRECLKLFQNSRISIEDFRGVGLAIDMLDNQKSAKRGASGNQTVLDLFAPRGNLAAAAATEPEKIAPVSGTNALEAAEQSSLAAPWNPTGPAPPDLGQPELEEALLRDRQQSPDLWEYSPKAKCGLSGETPLLLDSVVGDKPDHEKTSSDEKKSKDFAGDWPPVVSHRPAESESEGEVAEAIPLQLFRPNPAPPKPKPKPPRAPIRTQAGRGAKTKAAAKASAQKLAAGKRFKQLALDQIGQPH